MIVEITEVKLFDSLLEWTLNEEYVDLHNDFSCIGIQYIEDEMKLEFVSDQDQDTNRWLNLIFSNPLLIKASIGLGSIQGVITLDNFHRGRLSFGDALLDESEDGKKCFYLEFVEGQSFEILASMLKVEYYSG